MLKKIAGFLVLAVILVSLCSCAGEKSSSKDDSGKGAEKVLTAEEIYLKAVEKNKNSKTTDMSVEGNIDIAAAGEIMSFGFQMRAKSDLSDENFIKLGCSTTLNVPEAGETKVNYAFIGDEIYIDSAGLKYKSSVTPEQAREIMGSSSSNELLENDAIKNAQLTKDGEDNIITFEFDESIYNDLIEESLSGVADMNGMGYEIKEISGSVVIDKDFVMKSMKIDFGIEMNGADLGSDVEDHTVEMNMEMNIILNSIGEPVDISAPSDKDSYIDVSASELGVNAA